VSELGTGGSFATLLGDVDWLVLAERRADGRPSSGDVRHEASRVREAAGSDVGVAVAARPRGRDTAVSIAVVTPEHARRERRIAFLGGQPGRQRAALAAADVLLAALRQDPGRGGRRRSSPEREGQRREARTSAS